MATTKKPAAPTAKKEVKKPTATKKPGKAKEM